MNKPDWYDEEIREIHKNAPKEAEKFRTELEKILESFVELNTGESVSANELRNKTLPELKELSQRKPWTCDQVLGWSWLGVAKLRLYTNKKDYWSTYILFLWKFAFSIHLPAKRL